MPTSLQSCLECRGALPQGARFCPLCGARVAAGDVAPAGERRQATIVFADLSGYTRLSSTLDPEETHRLLTRFFELTDAVITRWGGAIDKHIGDAVMGVFGAPVAYGNDVERAIRAAVDVHANIGVLAKEFNRPLTAHVGIASGEVVAAATGSAAHRTYTVTGDAVNLAARLTELARGGETVVSADVQRTLAALADFEPLGPIAIRGLASSAPAFRVAALRKLPSIQQPLLGRDRERARFSGLLAAASAGRSGAVALIRADPGMGKTRLSEALLADSANQGAICIGSTVLDFGIEQGRDAIHTLICNLLEVSPATDASARRAALDRTITLETVEPDDEPFIADLLMIAQRTGSVYDALDNATRHRGKLRALASVVERTAARSPCVLLIEDIHWASPWVLEAAREVASCGERAPVILLMTSRRDGDPVDSTWPRGRMEVFDLAPLDHGDALALARAYLASSPDLALRCVERAQGNPLFLMQLLKSDTDESTVPPTIQSVVLARLDRLSIRDKSALQAASVIGQRFGLELLRHLIGDDEYAAVAPIERDLVRADSARPDQMMFTHALIRDGAYASLLHSSRRDLHLTAARWYETRDLTLRAEHLDRAGDPAAAEAYLAAARAEVAALRVDAALELAERGATLGAMPAIRHALAMVEGTLDLDLGRGPKALAAFERARDFATSNDERCAAWIGIASVHRLTSDVALGLAALDAALPFAAASGNVREHAHIHYLCGSLHFTAGDIELCRAEHERALQLAQECGDVEREAQAQSGVADALYAQGRMQSARAAFARCVELCDRNGFAPSAIMNRCMLAVIERYFGAQETALASLEHARSMATKVKLRAAEAMAEECIGWVLASCGRYSDARAPLEHGLALAREIGMRRFEVVCLLCIARVLKGEGAEQEALSAARAAWELCEEFSPRFAGPSALVLIAALVHDDGERRQSLAAAERLLAEGCVGHTHLEFYPAAIDIALDKREWSEAERYADALEDYARAEPLPWSRFYAMRGRSLAAAGRGSVDRALLAQLRDEALALGYVAAVPAIDEALRTAYA
ncbi:MAG TPA: adenylate/guanylate cyclase domain-containing protein [Casimicrobiaceae bacterium]